MSHIQTFILLQHQTESMQFLELFPILAAFKFLGRIIISTLHIFTMSHFQTIQTSNKPNAVFGLFPNSNRGSHFNFNPSLLVADGCFGVKYVFAVPPFKTRGQQFHSHRYHFLNIHFVQ